MCFAYEADWCAEVQEEGCLVNRDKPTKCCECHEMIAVGDIVHHIYQQEHECCQDCEYNYCACKEDKCCQCDPPNYGVTYEYNCCENCWKFREAIKELELEDGCAIYEAQPLLGAIVDDLLDMGGKHAKKYWLKALRKYPELKTNGYLGGLWNSMFVR